MPSTKCEAAIVRLVIVTRDEDGEPIREQTSDPFKVLRNKHTVDFWAEMDKAVQASQQRAGLAPASGEA